MQYDKLQLGCLLIVLYVAFIYVRERYAYKIKKSHIKYNQQTSQLQLIVLHNFPSFVRT